MQVKRQTSKVGNESRVEDRFDGHFQIATRQKSTIESVANVFNK